MLRVDRRGHGRSDAYDGDWSPRDHADDIAELACSLGIQDAVAIGHAGGGSSAHELTGRYSDLVRSMVLVDDGLRRGVSNADAAAAPFVQQLERAAYLEVFVPQYRT